MHLQELESILNQRLQSALFQDYAPNGIQIAGKSNIKRIVTGVTASQKLIDAAVRLNADAVLVHHGYFWKNEPQALIGMKYQRIKTLIQHNIALLAYHLPLDADPILGNNAQLGQLLDIKPDEHTDLTDLLFTGEVDSIDPIEFGKWIENKLQHSVIFSGELDQPKPIKKVAWCSGGAQDYIEQALEKHCDAFITGEVSERTIHIARENNLYFYAAGHHATERYGILALGNWLQANFNLEVIFVDIDNPA